MLATFGHHGYFWPSWLLIPYIVILWRISKEFLESRRDSLQTQFPVLIGRRHSSPKDDQSVDWIVAVQVPPKELLGDSPNRRVNSNEDDKIYLVTKAVPKFSPDESRK